MATADAWKKYVNAMNSASVLAQKELMKTWGLLDKSKPEECRDALIELLPPIIEKYGGMAALAASEYYEAERTTALGGSYDALVAETVDRSVMESAVRYAAGHMFPTEVEDGMEPGTYTGLFD